MFKLVVVELGCVYFGDVVGVVVGVVVGMLIVF